MVAEILLGWAIGEFLSGAKDLAKRGLSRSEQEEIRTQAVSRLRAALPPGEDGDLLAGAAGDQLSARRVVAEVKSGADLSVLLADQLKPLLNGCFDGSTGTALLARLGIDFARLVELTEQAIVAAAHDVAAQRGGLPLWSTHQKLDQIIEQPSPRATDTLGAAPEHMVGRRRELDELARHVRIMVIHGMGGVGKTALVRAFAAEVRDRFPNGRFEADLHGFTPGFEPRSPDLVLAELLRQVGFPPAEIPAELAAKSERWRGWLADRAVLLILDNARSAEDVRPLLPGNADRCLVVVTSRNRLDDLDTSFRLSLDTLPEPDAIALLRELSARDENFAEIAHLCGYLPLALRAVGPLLGRIPAADLAASIVHVHELDQKVRAAFAVSYEDLSAELQRLLRWCGFHPGPDFDAGSAAAIWDLPEPIAAVRLDDLTKRNLLLAAKGGRYALHDLFSIYVRELAALHDETHAASARSRLFENLRERTRMALWAGTAKWLWTASPELKAAATDALAIGWRQAGQLVRQVGGWLGMSGQTFTARELYGAWLDLAERTDDEDDRARAWASLAQVAWLRGEYSEAAEGFRRALPIHEGVGSASDSRLSAWGGLAQAALARGDYGEATEGFRKALSAYEEAGNGNGQAYARGGLGRVALACGDSAEAAQQFHRSLALYREAEVPEGRADALVGLGDIARLQGKFDESTERLQEALAIYEEAGSRHGQADVHHRCGELAEAMTDSRAARLAYQKARSVFTDIGNQYRANLCADALERLGCE